MLNSSKMSCNADETNAASVLSQLSQCKKIANQSDSTLHVDGSVIAHECDVETSNQEIASVGENEVLDASGTSVMVALCNSEPENKAKILSSFSSTAAHNDTPPKVFPCEYCGKIFSKSYNLKTHHRVHSGERPYQCDVCGHGFANLGDLKRHKRIHTGEKPYSCEYCGRSFSDYGSHKRHLRLHTGYKPYKCEECNREFTRLDSYKNHLRLHTGIRPYKCEICLKEFNYLTTYKRHRNVHSGERPFSCEQCGKTFTRSVYLKNHKRGNCGKEREQKSRAKKVEEISSHVQSAQISLPTVSDISVGTVTENVAQNLSFQGGVQFNVAKVVYTSHGSQQVLFESNETISHTLILTTNPENGQQLLELSAESVHPDKATLPHSDISRTNNDSMYLNEGLSCDKTAELCAKVLHDDGISGTADECYARDLSAFGLNETVDESNKKTFLALAPYQECLEEEKS